MPKHPLGDFQALVHERMYKVESILSSISLYDVGSIFVNSLIRIPVKAEQS